MITNEFILDSNTRYFFEGLDSITCQHAKKILGRDISKVLDSKMRVVFSEEEADVIFVIAPHLSDEPEKFFMRVTSVLESKKMVFDVVDDLAFMYAVLYFSRSFLEIQPFWFWMDQKIKVKNQIIIETSSYESINYSVRYRGWFINDEVNLIGWTDLYPPPREVWFPVFEALLRCGGNMVLPGTDLPKEGNQINLATEMGLWVTQHHAEPLDGEMFLRAYPNLKPSYDQYSHLFENLWESSILENKDRNVIWTLGFRGQGDIPFWESDPSYSTPEERAALITYVINRQYELLCKYIDKPVCSVYLYQETMELYNAGLLKIDDRFIKVWSDNGYGKMLTRRHGQWDPRTPSLPQEVDGPLHGIYYHVAFHDLEASNHLTMLCLEPKKIVAEIEEANQGNGLCYTLINSANVKQHIVALETIRRFWNQENTEDVVEEFVRSYYSSNYGEIIRHMNTYLSCGVRYGPFEDNLIGDEYYHHTIRKFISAWFGKMSGNTDEVLIAPYMNVSNLDDQIKTYSCICKDARGYWSELYEEGLSLLDRLNDDDFNRYMDNFFVQVVIHYFGSSGAVYCCQAYEYYVKKDYITAYLRVGKSIESQQEVLNWLTKVQHDKWEKFYSADWLTNINATVFALEAVRKFLRIIGDGPNLFYWHKYYIMPLQERHIYLENTQRQVFTDDELTEKLIHSLRI